MLYPFYMLTGKIDLLKESKPFKLNGKIYTEKTYIDEHGSRSIIAVPITPLRGLKS